MEAGLHCHQCKDNLEHNKFCFIFRYIWWIPFLRQLGKWRAIAIDLFENMVIWSSMWYTRVVHKRMPIYRTPQGRVVIAYINTFLETLTSFKCLLGNFFPQMWWRSPAIRKRRQNLLYDQLFAIVGIDMWIAIGQHSAANKLGQLWRLNTLQPQKRWKYQWQSVFYTCFREIVF